MGGTDEAGRPHLTRHAQHLLSSSSSSCRGQDQLGLQDGRECRGGAHRQGDPDSKSIYSIGILNILKPFLHFVLLFIHLFFFPKSPLIHFLKLPTFFPSSNISLLAKYFPPPDWQRRRGLLGAQGVLGQGCRDGQQAWRELTRTQP